MSSPYELRPSGRLAASSSFSGGRSNAFPARLPPPPFVPGGDRGHRVGEANQETLMWLHPSLAHDLSWGLPLGCVTRLGTPVLRTCSTTGSLPDHGIVPRH